MKLLVVGDLHGKIDKFKKKVKKQDFDFIIGIGDYSGVDEWKEYWVGYVFKLKKGEKRKSPRQFWGKEKFKEVMRKDEKAEKDTLSLLNNLGKAGFFVFGNGDDGWYKYSFSKKILKAPKKNLNFLKRIKNIKEMTYKVRHHKGISFLGFGGYMDSSANDKARDKEWQTAVDKRNSKAQKKMNSLIKKIWKKSIFILHYPPRGIFDKILDKKNNFYGEKVGPYIFRDAILKKKPLLVLCGHMHEYVGKKKLGSSLVVNPGEGSKGKFAIVDLDEIKWKIRGVKFL